MHHAIRRRDRASTSSNGWKNCRPAIGTCLKNSITVEATGASEIVSVKIGPVLAERNGMEMITVLLTAAINDVLGKAKQLQVEAMALVTEEPPLPNGMEGMLNKLMGGGE